MLSDYLALEPVIIDRLESEVTELVLVGSAPDLDGLAEGRQATPSAYVIYGGDQVPTNDRRISDAGKRHVITQRWFVVLAVRNVRDTVSGSGVRSDAGPLLSKIITALAGEKPWVPVSGIRPLRRAGAPRPSYRAGYGLFPLLFTADVIT